MGRNLIAVIGALTASFAFLSGAVAQNKAVDLLVPVSPGSGPDIIARILSARYQARTGTIVVVENKPGAAGNLAADQLARAKPDGQTLMVIANTFTITPSMYKHVPYNPLTDFTPIAKLAVAEFALVVNPDVQAKSVSELVALVKASPGKLNFASPGKGSPHHLAMELLMSRLKLDATHVPYAQNSAAITDLIGGQVEIMFLPVHSALQQARVGKLRILATTGVQRSALTPDVPTFREQGMDFMDTVDNWYALLAPAGLPKAMLDKLNADYSAIVQSPEVREAFEKQGLRPVSSTPEELGALIKSDLERWRKVIQDAKISAD